jgi:hypothetical protein
MPTDWYYIYSDRYLPFHYYLQDKINRVHFTPQGIPIDQAVFDKDLYKHKGEHFFSRISVKVDNIVQILKDRIAGGNQEPFFFSDCDILVGAYAVESLPVYTEQKLIDCWFQKEHNNETVANPGFILVRANHRTLAFWSGVQDDIVLRNMMEMKSINDRLSGPNGPPGIIWQLFDTTTVCSSLTRGQKDFGVYHILCGCKSRQEDMMDKYIEANLQGHPMDIYVDQAIAKLGAIVW